MPHSVALRGYGIPRFPKAPEWGLRFLSAQSKTAPMNQASHAAPLPKPATSEARWLVLPLVAWVLLVSLFQRPIERHEDDTPIA